MKSEQYRQGDVFLEKIDYELKDYEILPRSEQDSIILAYGESTGHKHQIKSKNAVLVKYNDKIFLMVIKESTLYHEEHAAAVLPAGNFKVTIQRNYTPKGIQNVKD